MDGNQQSDEPEWDGERVGIHEFTIGSDDGLEEFLEKVGEHTSELVNESGGRPAVVKFQLQVKNGGLNRPNPIPDLE